MSTITALAPWFGSNRMLASKVGTALKGCNWVGVVFAGGMSELLHIDAPTMVVNDLHRHVINLARVVGDEVLGPKLYRRLRRLAFHPNELQQAQVLCGGWEHVAEVHTPEGRLEWAENYFVCCWMGRSAKAGTDSEFTGGLPVRWSASGGDSNTRYRSAVRSLRDWRRVLQRCNFTTLDAFEFLGKCKDEPKHGIYCDPPFEGPGDAYKHKFSAEDQLFLANWLSGFTKARVVCRFYDHHLVRQLYPADRWEWRELKGRKQSNDEAPEVLLTNRI